MNTLEDNMNTIQIFMQQYKYKQKANVYVEINSYTCRNNCLTFHYKTNANTYRIIDMRQHYEKKTALIYIYTHQYNNHKHKHNVHTHVIFRHINTQLTYTKNTLIIQKLMQNIKNITSNTYKKLTTTHKPQCIPLQTNI